ncbi:hypothetical protein imdm_1900 [gamma proteobacterium IMCC2047]|nr:hypothetical protein imdm_1900 [gamma proteobacterium IMCC2047]
MFFDYRTGIIEDFFLQLNRSNSLFFKKVSLKAHREILIFTQKSLLCVPFIYDMKFWAFFACTEDQK